MATIKVTQQTIFKDQLSAEEQQDPRFAQGSPEPDMRNTDIEDDDYRMRLEDNTGNLCIGIQPGDELGEMIINIQFEGKKSRWNQCMTGQNGLLLHASHWLADILGDLDEDGDWEITLEAKPCPNADVVLELDAASQILEQQQTVEHALNDLQVQTGDVTVEVSQENLSVEQSIQQGER